MGNSNEEMETETNKNTKISSLHEMWELPYVGRFLRTFGELLKIPEECLQLEDFEEALSASTSNQLTLFANAEDDSKITCNPLLFKLHKVLLKGIYSSKTSITEENWVKMLRNFIDRHGYDWVWDVEIGAKFEKLKLQYAKLEKERKEKEEQEKKLEEEREEEEGSGDEDADDSEEKTKIDKKKPYQPQYKWYNPLGLHTNCQYDQVPIKEKLLIIKNLCEAQFEDNSNFNEKLKRDDAPSMDKYRLEPMGKDQKGLNYWYFEDFRLYRESEPEAKEPIPSFATKNWEMVCGSKLTDWQEFLDKLNEKANQEKKLKNRIIEQILPLVAENETKMQQLQKKRQKQMMMMSDLGVGQRKRSSRILELQQKKTDEQPSQEINVFETILHSNSAQRITRNRMKNFGSVVISSEIETDKPITRAQRLEARNKNKHDPNYASKRRRRGIRGSLSDDEDDEEEQEEIAFLLQMEEIENSNNRRSTRSRANKKSSYKDYDDDIDDDDDDENDDQELDDMVEDDDDENGNHNDDDDDDNQMKEESLKENDKVVDESKEEKKDNGIKDEKNEDEKEKDKTKDENETTGDVIMNDK